jgi:hypothetical protein
LVNIARGRFDIIIIMHFPHTHTLDVVFIRLLLAIAQKKREREERRKFIAFSIVVVVVVDSLGVDRSR